MAGFNATVLFDGSAQMKLSSTLLCGLAALAMPGIVAACNAWPPLPHEALRGLAACAEPAVERQAGQVCLRHEWLCGQATFKDWFEHWMAQLDEPVAMEKRLGQMIFSGQHQDTAWAVFWLPVDEDAKGFVVLVSRMRAALTKEK